MTNLDKYKTNAKEQTPCTILSDCTTWLVKLIYLEIEVQFVDLYGNYLI